MALREDARGGAAVALALRPDDRAPLARSKSEQVFTRLGGNRMARVVWATNGL